MSNTKILVNIVVNKLYNYNDCILYVNTDHSLTDWEIVTIQNFNKFLNDEEIILINMEGSPHDYKGIVINENTIRGISPL